MGAYSGSASLDIESLQNIILAIAESESVDAVLRTAVHGLAGQPDVALTRIWLIAPGDICQSCSMRSVCPDQARCLHLVASAGNPLINQDSGKVAREAWNRTNGDFQRIPLNIRSKPGHVAMKGSPIHLRVKEGREVQSAFLRPDWVKAQKIRCLVGQPLIFKNDFLGALAVFSRAELSDRDVGWFRTIAAHVAVAIANLQVPEQAVALHGSLAAMAEQWRSVFEKSAIGVALTDENGRFLHVNHAYEQVLGYTEGELRKLSFYDITPEEYRESNRLLAAELWAGKCDLYQFEKPYRHKDGSLVWVRLHASLVPGTKSVPHFGLALCEDITERKRAEETLKRSEERRRTLLEINNAIITKLNQNELFHAICEALKRVVSFARVALILYDPAVEILRIAALEGPFRGENFAVGYEVGQESVSRWVFDHRRPLLRKDLETESQYPTERLLVAEGIRSLCALPLIVREEPSGVLFVASPTKGEYSEDDVPFLQEVANQVALAVGNMRSYEELGTLNKRVARTADQLRTLLEVNNAIITDLSQEALLRSIAKALRRVVPFDRAALTLYQPDKDVFRFVAIEGVTTSDYFQPGLEINPQESSVGLAFRLQLPFMRHDLEKEKEYLNERRLAAMGMRSHCVVPLIGRGKSIGTLNVAHSLPNQYSEEVGGFLQEVANQIALAIENMKAYEEIAALNARLALTADHLRTLLEINNALVTNLSEESLLHAVSDAIHRVVPFDRAALTLYLPEKGVFRYLGMESRLGSSYFLSGMELDRKSSVSEWVFDHQQAVVRKNLEEEGQYANDRRLVAEGVRSDCVVPLIFRGKSLGTLNVGSTTMNQYTDSDARFLQEVANQVALAVENMKSYEEIARLKARLEQENIYLQEEIRTEHNFEEIIGNSPALLETLRALEQVAPTDSTVLIFGETGTGKELIARAVHNRSARKGHPLVRVDCSAISAGLVESELFGHMKGAFTGAFERRTGRFELADGGTIFLDEIGELPLEIQAKLLRVIQEHEFEPVGSSRSVRVDVRVIAATNRNLEESVRAGRFRSDLFYRLNVFPLEVPPLRDRPSDIPHLVAFFLSRFSKKFGKRVDNASQETMDRLVNYPWPGNVRELQNVIERAVILSPGHALLLNEEFLPGQSSGGAADEHKMPGQETTLAGPQPPRLSTLEEIERSHILAALQQTDGVIEGPKGAAIILNLHPNTLRHRMKKLGIRRSAHRPQ